MKLILSILALAISQSAIAGCEIDTSLSENKPSFIELVAINQVPSKPRTKKELEAVLKMLEMFKNTNGEF